jgi:mannose-6-phosphate isomerase
VTETRRSSTAAKSNGRMRAAETVPKPWGREVWYANESHYAGKILEVKKGHSLSLQKHELKTETMYVLSGRIWFHLNSQEFEFVPGA